MKTRSKTKPQPIELYDDLKIAVRNLNEPMVKAFYDWYDNPTSSGIGSFKIFLTSKNAALKITLEVVR